MNNINYMKEHDQFYPGVATGKVLTEMKKMISLILCAVLPLWLFGCKNVSAGSFVSREPTLAQNLAAGKDNEYPFRFEDFEWLATEDEVLAVIHTRGISEDHISHYDAGNYVYLSTREKNPFRAYKATDLITVYRLAPTNDAQKSILIGGDYYFVEPDQDAMKADKTAISKDLSGLPGRIVPFGSQDTSVEEGCLWLLDSIKNGEKISEPGAQYCLNPDPRLMGSPLSENGELLINVCTMLTRAEWRKLWNFHT